MKATCPNCQHTFESTLPRKGARICAECGNVISRHDKWFFRPDGKVQHRHCSNPEGYLPALEEQANLRRLIQQRTAKVLEQKADPKDFWLESLDKKL